MIPTVETSPSHSVTRIANADPFSAVGPGVSAELNECENRALVSMTAAAREEEAVCH